MATKPLWKRGGLSLECNVSETPRRRPSSAYALPDLQPAADSLLTLTLENVSGSGRKAIRVTSQALPSAPTISWGLEHFAYQGSRPASPTWEQLVCTNPVNTLLADAMPSAVHVFRLTRSEAGQVRTLPEASITTPADTVATTIEAMLSNDVVSVPEKTSLLLAYQQLLGEQTTVGGAAAEWGVPRLAYDAAVQALKDKVATYAPPLADRTQDTPLGTGGGAALWALWQDVCGKRDAVLLQVEQARKQGLEQMLGDSRLPPGERRRVKAERDRIQAALTELEALAALGVPAADATAALAAFRTAAQDLETHLNALAPWDPGGHDWDTYDGIVDLGTGGGPALYAKIKAASDAESTARRLLTLDTRKLTVAIGSDGAISAGADKARWRLEWTRVQAEYTSVWNQAYGLGVYRNYLEAAYNALSSYIANLVPPLTDGTKDTPVVASSWEARWNDYYTRVAEVQRDCGAVLKAKADQATTEAAQALAKLPVQLQSLPFPPGASYPEGREVWLLSYQQYNYVDYQPGPYRSTGTGWTALPYHASMLVGQLTAHIVAAHAVGADSLAANLALVSILMAGYAEDANGVPIRGARLSGVANETPLKLGPDGVQIGAMSLSEAIVRSLALLDSRSSGSTSHWGIIKGNNNPAVRMGAPNPDCLSLTVELAVEGTLYDLWLFQLRLQPTGFDDNLDAMVGGEIIVTSGGSTQASAPYSIGSRSYGDANNHANSVNSSGTVVPVKILSSCRSGGRLHADISVLIKNSYFYATAFFNSSASGVTRTGGTSTGGSTNLGGKTVGGGRNAKALLLS